MSDMALVSPAMMAAMMVAMMLPSFAPTLWRYHGALSATRVPRAACWTLLFALGYTGIWSMIGGVLYALSDVRLGSWATGLVVVAAGLVQCTRWKATRLARCRHAFAAGCAVRRGAATSLRDGWRFGVDCALSCAAPTAVLFAIGLMDTSAMAAITAAITAERLVPKGTHIARMTGAAAVCTGVIMWMQTMR